MKKTTFTSRKAIKHLRKNWIKYGFETLVVVIGILMAFALNNWNENRIGNKLEKQYLERLAKDLKADTTYYNDRIASSEYLINYHREFIRKMHQTQKSFNEVQDLFSNLTWNSEQLTVQNVTYIELTNSGNLDILKNQDFKEGMIQYYRKNEEAAKHIAEFNEFSSKYLLNLGFNSNHWKFYNFINDIYDEKDMISIKEWEFINYPSSKEFQFLENTLAVYRYKHKIFLDYFKGLKTNATQLIKDIQKELDFRN